MRFEKGDNMKILGVIVGLVFLLATGCATERTNLAENGTVTIEKAPSENIYVSDVYAYQEGNELVVSGALKRSNSSNLGDGGVVTVAATDPSGKTFEESSDLYFPKILPKKGARESRFTFRLPIAQPDGTKIRIAYLNP